MRVKSGGLCTHLAFIVEAILEEIRARNFNELHHQFPEILQINKMGYFQIRARSRHGTRNRSTDSDVIFSYIWLLKLSSQPII